MHTKPFTFSFTQACSDEIFLTRVYRPISRHCETTDWLTNQVWQKDCWQPLHSYLGEHLCPCTPWFDPVSACICYSDRVETEEMPCEVPIRFTAWQRRLEKYIRGRSRGKEYSPSSLQLHGDVVSGEIVELAGRLYSANSLLWVIHLHHK